MCEFLSLSAFHLWGEGAWCSYCNTSSDSSWSVPLALSSARSRCQPSSGLSWSAPHPGALSIGKPENKKDFPLHLEGEKRPRKFSVCHMSQTHACAVSVWLRSFPHSAQNLLLPQHCPDWILPSSAPAVPCHSSADITPTSALRLRANRAFC